MFITTLSTCSVASYKTGKICFMALFLMFLWWHIAGLQPPCRAWWDGRFDTASLWAATNQWQLQWWAITAAKIAGHRSIAAGAFEEHGSFRGTLGISVLCNRSVGMCGFTRLCGIRSNLCSSFKLPVEFEALFQRALIDTIKEGCTIMDDVIMEKGLPAEVATFSEVATGNLTTNSCVF